MPQASYMPTKQSTGQLWLLQTRLSVRCAQAAPSCAIGVTTLRSRVSVPPAQVLSHSVHELKEESTQSTGQGAALQDSLSEAAKQATPPCIGWALVSRVRVRVPPPQSTLHLPQLCHPSCTQSTGQAPTPQSRDTVSCGHVAPPCKTGVEMTRLRLWVPEPHDLVHALQPEYSETTQSTAHAAELHVFTSLRCGQV